MWKMSSGNGNRNNSEQERVLVRQALRSGEINDENAKEGMRFGAATSDATSQGSAWTAAAQVEGTRAGMHWFGITVASFEHGDIRQSPNGVYVYSDDGRREVRVEGGRGTGTVEMAD